MMTMNKNLLIFFIFVIPLINFIFATPVLLSDQGTDLKLVSTGELLSTGNITIYIYDSVTGGSLIYSNLFINNITNGSWNVVINPNLEYGKHYWKDYSVNGDNLNFSGNDRIEFQSPLGLINNASLFNFSLINSCAVGSSIRQVYENGSVLCETDDTGSGGNSSWNQSLANGLYISQVEEDNLDVNSSLYSNSSTWWSGLSSWLSGWFINNAGVLEFNETKLNNTIDSRASGLGDNSSWNQSLANSLYILQSTEGNLDVNSSVYSNSTTWWSGLTSWLSGWFINNAGVLTFNETKLNNTIDLRAGGDNSSWNESYANTQYASISEPLWSANFTAYNSSWSSTFNSTYDGYNSTELIKDWNSTGYIKNWNNTGLIINWSTSLTNDNTSWNESYANTRYLLQSEEGNLDVNSSVYSNSSTWWSGLYSYLSGWFVNNAGVLEFNETKLNNTIDLRAGGDNSSWNESYADTQYSSISEPLWSANFTAYNSSWSSTFNSTYDGYNSTGLIKDWNSTGYIKDWNNTGLIINWSSYLISDNSSWNESYANTRYLLQSEEGNLDVNSSVYSNSSTWWSGLYSYLSGWFVNNAGVLEFNETKLNNTIDLRAGGDNSSWNESYANTKYLQNGTSVRFTDVNSTGNITTEEIHFENDIVNHRIYDNSTCVIINGDTSTMYIF